MFFKAKTFIGKGNRGGTGKVLAAEKIQVLLWLFPPVMLKKKNELKNCLLWIDLVS